ncbi:MAG: HlyD family efflux transporter periplasmic adaptor subunit [Syntrophomonadaceae bacterium]|nr:HlyD family efflux transporter periplasmic adaptor subunit [Syntrophomonadaceae bacterium]
MNRKPLLLLLIGLILISIFYYYRYHLTNVDSSAITASGTIEATTVELCSKSNGTLGSVLVAEGDLVTAGQLVAEINRPDLLLQKERDLIAVEIAESRLRDLVAGARPQEIQEAEAAFATAQDNLKLANQELERCQALFQAGAISQASLDTIILNQKTRENQFAAAQARLSLLKSGNRPELISAAQDELERAKAILKVTETMIEDLKILSPIDGTVINKNFEAGEYVQPGAPIATVADLQNLWVKVYIATDDLPNIRLNQKVDITVSGSSKVFEGKVSHIASQGEFTPKTIQTKQERTNVVFAVKIGVLNHDGVLKPGMPADISTKRVTVQ